MESKDSKIVYKTMKMNREGISDMQNIPIKTPVKCGENKGLHWESLLATYQA